MALPERVRAYLQALYADQLSPFTLAVDRDGVVRDWWGDPGSVGMADIARGDAAVDHAPWLHGLSLNVDAVLPEVETQTGFVFDLHFLPGNPESLIVFEPVGAAVEARRSLQQTANEVRILNHRQRRLMEQLEKANARAERANTVQARFIAGMSHEFRTPLTSVLGYADLLLESEDIPGEATAYAVSIGRAARHLLSMVDNVLDRARLDDDKIVLNMSPVDVRSVADDLAAMVAPLAADKALGFAAYVSNAVPAHVMTDVVRLRQVLLNIVGNAVKFTNDGEVSVEVDWEEDVLTVAVTDTGPGIPPGEMERIFDAFRRGAGAVGTRGTGLGLNITRRLLERLGGGIEVTSEVGEGSCFRIRIPAPPTHYADSADTSKTRPDASVAGAHVLLAEDDVDIVALMQIILGRAGYRLTLATNGQAAIDMALAEQPDLVLMDMNMPELDGLAATRALREQGFDKPVLALSASLGAHERGLAIDAGCDDYLVKPVATPDLLEALGKHLETSRHGRSG